MGRRLSSADSAWLHMDRATNLMVINAVLLFDQRVRWNRVSRILQRRLVEAYPRFRQRVVEPRVRLGPPRWEDDPDFALEHHVHHRGLPPPGSRRDLQELIGDLMAMPLDHDRPLWHVYLVDGFGEGAAVIVRMHHCIADGISLARVMLSLTDVAADAGIGPPPDEGPPLPRRGLARAAAAGVAAVLTNGAHDGVALARHGLQAMTSPAYVRQLAGAAGRDGTTLVRLLLTPADAPTAIKGDPGISRRVAWTRPLSLKRIKRIAHAHEATVNDVLLAAVSGGLRHYLQERGGTLGEIQAMVPFNLRPLDEPVPRDLGNKFGLVMVPLPVGLSGSKKRLAAVRHRMQEIKHGRDAAVSYGLLAVTGMAPEPVERRIVDLFSAKGSAVVTNVPGPTEPVFLAGTPVRSVLVWAPTSGHIGMSISIFSYRGEVTLGLMVDAALVPDPAHVVKHFQQELTALERLNSRAATPAPSPAAGSGTAAAHPPPTL